MSKRRVYEVISVNLHNGSKDSNYFDSLKAATRWKEQLERYGSQEVYIANWPLYSFKDI